MSKKNCKKCTECKFCYLQDFGYSNYTVMGVDFQCLKKKNPNGIFDLWYGEAKELEFANECDCFIGGDGIEIDCDMELGDVDEYTDDKELIELYKNL